MSNHTGEELPSTGGDEALPAPFESELDLDPETVAGYETFHDWLNEDFPHRYRVRSALSTLNIKKSKYLGKGYTSRPFIDMVNFCEHFDLVNTASSQDRKTLAKSFFHGTIELRDFFSGDSDAENNLSTFSQLPYPLQVMASIKVIENKYYLGHAVSHPSQRDKLKDKLTTGLQAPETISEDILRSTAIVHAHEVIEDILRDSEGCSLNATNVDPRVLAGPSNPEAGIHLGYDLEQGAQERFRWLKRGIIVTPFIEDDQEWFNDEDNKDYRAFWPRVNQMLESAMEIGGVPEEDREQMKSYLLAKTFFGHFTKPRTATVFHGGLDQFVGMKQPVKDSKYKQSVGHANQWLEAARKEGLDTRGEDLAKQSFAMGLVEKLDREVVYGKDRERKGRLGVVVDLLSELIETSPDLAESVLNASPILKSTLLADLKRQKNPWGHLFES